MVLLCSKNRQSQLSEKNHASLLSAVLDHGHVLHPWGWQVGYTCTLADSKVERGGKKKLFQVLLWLMVLSFYAF